MYDVKMICYYGNQTSRDFPRGTHALKFVDRPVRVISCTNQQENSVGAKQLEADRIEKAYIWSN